MNNTSVVKKLSSFGNLHKTINYILNNVKQYLAGWLNES
jgi:hypothetical protein